jgi:hypothetical protein
MTRRFSLVIALAMPLVALFGPSFPATPAAAGPGDPTRLSAFPPELVGDKWLNVPEKEHPTLKKPKGKVTVIHFWTFG